MNVLQKSFVIYLASGLQWKSFVIYLASAMVTAPPATFLLLASSPLALLMLSLGWSWDGWALVRWPSVVEDEGGRLICSLVG